MASNTVAVRVSDEVLEKLTERATRAGQSVSEAVRQLIQDALKEGQNATNQAVTDDLSKRLDRIEKLALKATRAAAKAQFLASLSVNFTSQTARLVVSGSAPSSEEQTVYMAQSNEWADGFASTFIDDD